MGARYATLDDPAVREAAQRDPDGLLAANPAPLILDEIQGAPDLLRAVTLAVDRDPSPGQYLLTGSANVLAMRQVQESLAGRAAIHELLPLSLAELIQSPRSAARLNELFSPGSADELVARLSRARREGPPLDLRAIMVGGGYPTPALTPSSSIRSRWFQSCVQSYVERDVPAIAGIQFLGSFQRLFDLLLLLRSGNLLNVMDLSRTLGLPAATVHGYVDLLRLTHQVDLLPPLWGNPEQRVVKTPKVYGTDTGLTAALTDTTSWEQLLREGRAGALLETWVHGELRKLRACPPVPPIYRFGASTAVRRWALSCAAETLWWRWKSKRPPPGPAARSAILEGSPRIGGSRWAWFFTWETRPW